MSANTSVEKTLKSLMGGKIERLQVSFDKHVNFEPGHHIPKADATSAPQISYPSAACEKSYLVVCLDLDAPYSSFRFMSPILHLNQAGLKTSPSASSGSLEAKETAIASWIAPGPPPGASPHRYVLFLFEQPSLFDASRYAPANGKDLGMVPWMRYSLDDWKKDAGLGDVIAANYFVSN